MREEYLVYPDWPAPANVHAFSTTRRGGVSGGPWESFNLGMSCGDDPAHVAANRQRLETQLPSQPLWMRQVHGCRVLGAADGPDAGQADARVTSTSGEVLVVLTADCLPVFFCDEQGETVGIAHAGWRGLAGGVIEATVARLSVPPEHLMAWLGPAIGAEVYEVGDDVRHAFESSPTFPRNAVETAFKRNGGRWLLDIPGAARLALEAVGVERVYGGSYCTYSDPARFFSHRRDGVTGRMANVIWRAPQ